MKTFANTVNNNNTGSSTLSVIETEESQRQKIEDTTQGLPARYFKFLHNDVLSQNKENAMIICNYVQSMRQELNLSDGYRQDVILLLGNFSIFTLKSFKEVTRENVLSFLNRLRKPEASDPLHKWIGTYNIYRMHLMRFFRWLYYPDIHSSKSRPKPAPVENIPQLKRKEKSIYKPADLWTDEDDSLFLRYCPNPRDRCYHAMSDDSACRPHELLGLRMKDVVFKITPDKTRQYAEILVNGKTGTRSIPLIDSIPYIKDWMTVAFNVYLALIYRTFCSSILDATPSSTASNINSCHTFNDSNKAKSCILHNSILAYQIQNVMS